MYLGQIQTPGFVPQDDSPWWEEGLAILTDAAGQYVQDQGYQPYSSGVVIPEHQAIPYYDVFAYEASGAPASSPAPREEPGRAGQLLALVALAAGGYAILRLGGAI